MFGHENVLGNRMFNLTWRQEIYKVQGQSMEEDSIYEDDFVIIDKKLPLVNGDIVVASLPDKRLIVKHLTKEDNHLIFSPFHKDNLFMFIDDAKIKGKVVSIVCNQSEKHKHD